MTSPEAVLDAECLDEEVLVRAASLLPLVRDGDVVAISLPSEAELAFVVLAAMRVGVAAPFNPAMTEAEAVSLLQDLRPRMLVSGPGSGAASAAGTLGIPVVTPEELRRGSPRAPGPPEPAATALILPTSGTTGRSKLVPLSHANLGASAANVAASLELGADDRCLSLMPYYHIHGLVAGLMAPLLAGGSVVATGRLEPTRLVDWLEELAPTWFTGVPTMHRAVLDVVKALDRPLRHRLRFIRSSSAPLPPSLGGELEARFGVPVIEAYGMTEASHQMASNPLPPRPRRPGTVGMATGTELALLSEGSVHREANREGEVVVRGPGVTAGYLDNEEANAAAFLDGWFRTGDVGRFDEEGYLSLVGRLKELINRGGEKIAPREIEEVLLGDPGVAQAVAFPYPHPTLGEDVAVAVVPAGAAPAVTALKELARRKLAPHKVPRHVFVVDEIPVGPTGKPQRNRLAGHFGLIGSRSEPGTVAPAPQGLARIWGDILGLEQVPTDVDFFALGGDSLRAVALVAAVDRELGRSVPLAFFAGEEPTLSAMAELVAGAAPGDEPRAAGRVAAVEEDGDGTEVSYSEEGVLTRSRLDPDGALYNVPVALDLVGELDRRRLQSALDRVVAESDALRTTFHRDRDRWRRSVAQSVRVPVAEHRLGAGEDLEAVLVAHARRPFDLARGPLLRCLLVETDPDAHVLLVTAHHSVMDGLSQERFLERLATAYREPASRGPSTASLASLASRQRRPGDRRRVDELRSYWTDALALLDRPGLLGKPEREGPGWPGGLVDFALAPPVVERLGQLARRARTTPFTVVLCALAAIVSRFDGTPDVVIGTPASNRHQSGALEAIGNLANLLAIRVDVAGNPTFLELLGRARGATLGAFGHQEYPYELVLADLGRASDSAPRAPFRVICQLRPDPADPDLGAGIGAQRRTVHTGTAKFDLSFDVRQRNDALVGQVEFSTELFERAEVEDLCDRLGRLLQRALADPEAPIGQLCLDTDEVRSALERGRGPQPDDLRRSVVRRVLEQAARTPDAPAIECRGAALSYRELDSFSESVARGLRGRGVGRGDVVGVLVPRDHELVAVLLGILRAGSAYMAIDPAFPASRVETMLHAVSAPLVVAATTLRDKVAAGFPAVTVDELAQQGAAAQPVTTEPVTADPDPEDLACVLFTSGSTGQPKAVPIKHRGIANVCSWAGHSFSGRELARVPVTASLNFDFSTFEMFVPLAAGGCLVVVDNVFALRQDGRGVTLLATVPTALRVLVEDAAIPRSVRTIVAGGERLSEDLATAILGLSQRPRLVNIYGPTEATVLCSAAEVERGDRPPPIGRPVDGALLLVMDRWGGPLPPGRAGELWVGGAGLADRYLGDPALSAERFVEAELPGVGRLPLYRTGDLVTADETGTFSFLGRADDQVKLRGIRIEPGEVEATLVAYPGVSRAVAYLVGEGSEQRLDAVLTVSEPVDIEGLRSFAEQRLPRYMVPQHLRVLDALPVTENGKVDRRSLARAFRDAPAVTTGPAPGAPGPDDLTLTEAVVAGIWSRLLQRRDLDRGTDFFQAGGNSLLALEMVIEVERRFDVRLPLTWLVDGPATLGRLSDEVRVASAALDAPDGPAPFVMPLRAGGPKPPLFLLYANATAALSARLLLSLTDPDRPLYAIAPNWTGTPSVEESVAAVTAVIETVGGDPVHLAGHSIGGQFAYEAAHRLVARGQRVGAVVLIDTICPQIASSRRKVLIALSTSIGRLAPKRATGRYRFDLAGAVSLLRRHPRPEPLDLAVDLLTTAPTRRFYGPLLGWEAVHRGPLTWHQLPGDHLAMLRAEGAAPFAELLERCVAAAEVRVGASPR